MPKVEKEKKARYYELLESTHTQNVYGKTTEDGKPVERTYVKGEKFWSETDLCAFNGPGMSPKFRVIGEDEGRIKAEEVPPPVPSVNVPKKGLSDAEMAELAPMSQKEIQQYAHNHKLDLKGAKTKDEMLKALKEG